MAVLLTGGTGKTSLRLATLLHDAKIPFLLASRNADSAAPEGMPATKFDWLDSSTFSNPFTHKFPGGEPIKAVYLVAPAIQDPVPAMNSFIDYAVKEHGVKRYVLLTGSSAEPNGPFVGKVWQKFLDMGLEYAVLKPTWFMENFSEQEHLPTIRKESKFYTACGDGKVPFIAAADIAAVAFRTLTDEKPHNADYRVLGPELLTFDEIATKLSAILGRKIEHIKLSEEEKVQRQLKNGVPEFFARFLTYLEVTTARGDENRLNEVVKQVTGRSPQTFDQFALEAKEAWL